MCEHTWNRRYADGEVRCADCGEPLLDHLPKGIEMEFSGERFAWPGHEIEPPQKEETTSKHVFEAGSDHCAKCGVNLNIDMNISGIGELKRRAGAECPAHKPMNEDATKQGTYVPIGEALTAWTVAKRKEENEHVFARPHNRCIRCGLTPAQSTGRRMKCSVDDETKNRFQSAPDYDPQPGDLGTWVAGITVLERKEGTNDFALFLGATFRRDGPLKKFSCSQIEVDPFWHEPPDHRLTGKSYMRSAKISCLVPRRDTAVDGEGVLVFDVEHWSLETRKNAAKPCGKDDLLFPNYNPQPNDPSTWVEGVTIVEREEEPGKVALFQKVIFEPGAKLTEVCTFSGDSGQLDHYTVHTVSGCPALTPRSDLAVDMAGNLLRDGYVIRFSKGEGLIRSINASGPHPFGPIATWSLWVRKAVAKAWRKVDLPKTEVPRSADDEAKGVDEAKGESTTFASMVVDDKLILVTGKHPAATAAELAKAFQRLRSYGTIERETGSVCDDDEDMRATEEAEEIVEHVGAAQRDDIWELVRSGHTASDAAGVVLRAKTEGRAVVDVPLGQHVALCLEERRREIEEARRRRRQRGTQRDGLTGGVWPLEK